MHGDTKQANMLHIILTVTIEKLDPTYTLKDERSPKMKMFCCFQPKIQSSSNERNINLTKGQAGHIYVVKEREFIKTNESIFKIGKSINIKNRMPCYPKDSKIILIFHSGVYDIHKLEKDIIARYDELFVKRKDIGSEYYECSESEIMSASMKVMQQVNGFTTSTF